MLVGGDIDRVNGAGVTNVARLNPDGSLDPVFQANASVTDASPKNIPPTAVYVLRVQPDGRIIVGGNFLRIDGTLSRYLGRMNADGTLDPTFVAIDPATFNPVLSQAAATGSTSFTPRRGPTGRKSPATKDTFPRRCVGSSGTPLLATWRAGSLRELPRCGSSPRAPGPPWAT